MRIVVQRVTNAKTVIEDNTYSEIGDGLLVLAGISKDDTKDDIAYCARKVANIRLFDDEEGKPWSKSVKDLKYNVLLQSQFTLYANMKKGNKPDFHMAMDPTNAKEFYELFVKV